MSRMLILTAILLLAIPLTMYGQSVSMDHVDGLVAGRLPVEKSIDIYIRLTNGSGHDFNGSANGFRIYSPDGASWDPWWTVDTACFDCCWPPPCSNWPDTVWYGEFLDGYLPNGLVWKGNDPQIFDGGLFVNVLSVDGSGADTVGFAGFDQSSGVGLYQGFDAVSLRISINRIDGSNAGKTLCLDSCFWPPSGNWLWANGVQVEPTWDGPHCWTIGEYCCVGLRGNLDLGDPGINIADLTALIRYMFGGGGGSDLPCPLAPNVNGDPGESVDISDLTYMIAYMFRGGPKPAACP